MYVIKVNTGHESLTYTFQNKSGDDSVGIGIFTTAFSKMFERAVLPATMTIMNEHGLYYSPSQNKYIHTENSEEVTIYLNPVENKNV